MKLLLVDTNLFEQCRELRSLPWSELGLADDLRLLVPRAVLREIDRHKTDSNQRRARRARDATSLFDQTMRAPGMVLVIRERDPRVEISFTPAGMKPHPGASLDLDRPDDQVIGDALALRSIGSSQTVAIFTHDTNLKLNAMHEGVEIIAIPETWLLPAERTESEKQFAALEARVKAMESQVPKIEAVFVASLDQDSEPLAELTITIVRHAQLTADEREDLVNFARQTKPIVESFDKNPPEQQASSGFRGVPPALQRMSIGLQTKRYVPPSDDEIESYRSSYEAWVEKLKELLATLHDDLTWPPYFADLRLRANNKGGAPASGALQEFDAYGGLYLLQPATRKGDINLRRSQITVPRPPAAPSGRWQSTAMSASIPSFDLGRYPMPTFPVVPAPRDPHTFYWESGSTTKLQTDASLSCAEWRHGVDDEYFELVLLVPPKGLESIIAATNVSVRCRITAANLVRPIETFLRIRVAIQHAGSFEAAKQLIFDQLTSQLPKKDSDQDEAEA